MNKLIGLAVFFLYLGCKNINEDPYKNTPTSGKIKIYVDETLKPIIDAELDVFHAFYKYAQITPVYLPEAEILNGLLQDSTELIISTRKLNPIESKYFKNKQLYPKEIKIAEDAISLIANPHNKLSNLSIIEINSILKGKINYWHQLRKFSKPEKINFVFDSEKSSTLRFFIDSVTHSKNLTNIFALENNEDVIEYVSKNIFSIGIIGASWISDRDDSLQLSFLKKVNVLGISREISANENNSYQPYQAYIFDHTYPFIRSIYVINVEARNGLATGFASFLSSDKGQRIILKSGILPSNSPIRLVKINNN